MADIIIYEAGTEHSFSSVEYLKMFDENDNSSTWALNDNRNMEDLIVSVNGVYTPSQGNYGINSVKVNVEPPLQDMVITENGDYVPGSGYYGINSVNVNVVPPLQSITIRSNGTYIPGSGYYGISSANVSVTPSLEELSRDVYPGENYTFNPTQGVDGFNSVKINSKHFTSVDCDITENGTYDIQTINNGYYADGFIFGNLNVSVDAEGGSIVNGYTAFRRWMNSPVIIESGMTNCAFLFQNLSVFNNPINIPDTVTNCAFMFDNCRRFNQPVYIPDSVTDWMFAFRDCNNYKSVVSVKDYSYNTMGINPLATTLGAIVHDRQNNINYKVIYDSSNNQYKWEQEV